MAGIGESGRQSKAINLESSGTKLNIDSPVSRGQKTRVFLWIGEIND